MSARSLARADFAVLATFRHALRMFLVFSENLAREAGLEPQQHQLLLAVKGLPAGRTANINTLAGRLQLRHHTVVELVDRLAAKGLVVRTRTQSDRRQVVVALTAEGERWLEPLVRKTLGALEETGPELIRALEQVIARGRPSIVRRRPVTKGVRSC